MNELSTHIEYLLLSHDCVVVPQFGAFMAMTATASRADEENLFFPPLRRVRFNADVTSDDGLLVASVARTHGIDESHAKRHVQTLVLGLRQQLLADGQIDFGSIGIFTQDEDGHVDFSACQAGAVFPEFYGLDAFTMPRVEHISKGTRARKKQLPLTHQDSDSHITIHISRRTIRQALTTAAAVLLCVLLSVPLRDSSNGTTQQAALTTPATETNHVAAQPFNAPAPVTTPETPEAAEAPTQQQQAAASTTETAKTEAPKTEQPKQETPKAERPKQETPKAEQPKQEAPKAEQPKQEAPKADKPAVAKQPQAAKDKAQANSAKATKPAQQSSNTGAPTAFAVVLASATSDANARSFVKELHDIGYTNARIYDNGRLKRVILDGYATEAAAIAAKHELQWNYEGFDDAWLLRP